MEPDLLLRRVEHTAIALCGAMAVAALILARGSVRPAVGVLAGGLLVGVSYWSIKAGVGDLLRAMTVSTDAKSRVPRGRIALQLVGRYALLGLMAYVMIARLRLHPLGLLAGASSVVAAVTVEAVRLFVKKS